MSNPYGPPVETPGDWNALMGCCCGMPVPPEPDAEIQERTYLKGAWGWNLVGFQNFYGQATAPEFEDPMPDSLIFYASVTRVTTDSNPEADPASSTFTVSDTPDGTVTETGDWNAGRFIQVDAYSNGTYTGSEEYTVTDENEVEHTYVNSVSVTFSLPVTLAAMTAYVAEAIQSQSWIPVGSGLFSGGSAYAVLVQIPVVPGSPHVYQVTVAQRRYRLIVPSTHLGSYFKVTWDLIFFPSGTGPRLRIARDLTWVWTGPGSQAAPNGDTWKSPWFEIPIPTAPGETRVVNVRYSHYR